MKKEENAPLAKEASPAKRTAFPSPDGGYGDILAALLATAVMPLYLYGLRVLLLLAIAMGTALLGEWICLRLRGEHWKKGDTSCLVTAIILVLLLPATVPWWMPVIGVVLALAVAKHPFGGTGHNIFNPAAAGTAFCAICWPELCMRYPVPYSTYLLENGIGQLSQSVQYSTSPASVLRVGGTPKIDYFDILLGQYVGPMGATCMLVLLCCLFYLLFRRRASLAIIIASFGVVAAFALFSPRVVTGQTASLIYEFSAEAFVFGVVFMANDPATMPKTRAGRIFYGCLIGVLVVAMRRFGQIELGFVYAILLANVFAHSCDRYASMIASFWDRLMEEPRKKASIRRRIREKEQALHAAQAPAEGGRKDA